jgi:hypothetical protein
VIGASKDSGVAEGVKVEAVAEALGKGLSAALGVG